jgi:hypothetical protein
VNELVMPGLEPGIHVSVTTCMKDVDGRAWASGSDAVLRTAMPGHDEKARVAVTPQLSKLRGIKKTIR